MSDLILRANLLSISLISGAASARAKEQPVTVDCVSPPHSRRVVSPVPGRLRLVTLTTVALSSFRIHKAALSLRYPCRSTWPCLLGDMLSILRIVTLV